MKIFKLIIYAILYLSIVIFSYIAIAFGLSFWTAHSKKIENKSVEIKKEKTIYILYSSVHSDIVINIKDSKIQWSRYLPQLLKSRSYGFLSFGWGDKETYLNTPTWNDLKISTALKALFINTPSLMHITYFRRLHGFKNLKKIKITKKQQDTLEKNILKSFGKEVSFYKNGYYSNDKFYNSSYKYNILNTCNTWTGERLNDANITINPWTPFAYNVIYSLD